MSAIVRQEPREQIVNTPDVRDIKELFTPGESPSPEPTPIPYDFIYPTKVDMSKIMHDPGQSNTLITVDPGVLDRDKAYEIYLEIESTGSHFGANFVVFEYNEANCITTFTMNISGQLKQCFAYLDNVGKLNIDIPVVLDPSSQDTIIHYKRVL